MTGLILIVTGFIYAAAAQDEITQLEKKYKEECVYEVKGDFYTDAYRGWFYREECKKLEEKIRQAKEKQTKKTPEKEKEKIELPYISKIKENMDNPVFWKKNEVYRWLKNDKNLAEIDQKTFREILDRVIYYSSLDPSNEEKISAAFYMIDYSRRKSLDFMYAYSSYLLKNPQYNIAAKIGAGSFEHQFVSLSQDKKINEILKNSKDYSIVMFGSSSCEYCREQARIFKYLKDEINPEIVVISSDSCDAFKDIATACTVKPDSFERFGIEMTPTIMIYVNKIFEPVYTGLINKTDLKRAIFSAYYRVKTGKYFDPANSKIEEVLKK